MVTMVSQIKYIQIGNSRVFPYYFVSSRTRQLASPHAVGGCFCVEKFTIEFIQSLFQGRNTSDVLTLPADLYP